tara:strand:+ start:291 stop:794 length:504 start_codon:yes stop_codon:yes gene_type:complete
MQKIFILLLFVTSIFSENIRVAIIQRHDNGSKKLLVKYLGEGVNEIVVERITYTENGDTLKLENLIDKIIMKREYYHNGNLMSEKKYKNTDRFGKYYYFYPNGQIEEEGEYINGTAHTINYWKQNGELIVKEGYGKLFTHLSNGQIYLEVDMKNGKFDGQKIYYFKD